MIWENWKILETRKMFKNWQIRKEKEIERSLQFAVTNFPVSHVCEKCRARSES